MAVSFWQNFRAIFFNIFHSPHAAWLQITGKIHARGVFMKNVKFKIKTKNISCFIEQGQELNNVTFYIHDSTNIDIRGKGRIENCKFYFNGGVTKFFAKDQKIKNSEFLLDDSSIFCGENFTLEEGRFSAGKKLNIKIGNDRMFSTGIEIRTEDGHSIFSKLNKQQINNGKSITIGDHVWLAANVKILKGVSISGGSVIANGAIVTKSCEIPNSIYAGVPAKLVKQNIYWNR